MTDGQLKQPAKDTDGERDDFKAKWNQAVYERDKAVAERHAAEQESERLRAELEQVESQLQDTQADYGSVEAEMDKARQLTAIINDAECTAGCDSAAHDDDCPVAHPVAAMVAELGQCRAVITENVDAMAVVIAERDTARTNLAQAQDVLGAELEAVTAERDKAQKEAGLCSDRGALAEKNDLISRGGWQREGERLDAAHKRIAALEAMAGEIRRLASFDAMTGPFGPRERLAMIRGEIQAQRLAAATEPQLHQGDPCTRCGVRYVEAGPVCPGVATEPEGDDD